LSAIDPTRPPRTAKQAGESRDQRLGMPRDERGCDGIDRIETRKALAIYLAQGFFGL
jgi:hypothetical protein